MDKPGFPERIQAQEPESLHHPYVTIILPLRHGVAEHLEDLLKKTQKELTCQYLSRAEPVIVKVGNALANINYASGKKSVVIMVSPAYEKVIYLDVLLEEKVMIDEPFEIRDLANKMRPADKYLVLVQSGEQFKIFLGDRYHLVKMRLHTPDHIAAFRNDIAEKIEYFSDVRDRKEIMMDKFIHHVDKELDSILHQHQVPVFVIGPERMNGHFKKYTHHRKAILDYIHGNYDDAKPHQLLQLIQPYLSELTNIENEEIADEIERARNANIFSFGIEEVWRNVMHKRGNVLLVERNYTYPHLPGAVAGEVDGQSEGADAAFIKDAVDIIIEQVIEMGGEVKFVDRSLLKDYGHIALLLYY